ncbi:MULTISPECIES: hypothetical protein [unclassified Thioalkalivibrio]|uniref:hypothetical protein n=1 Tax=unclassified Thioalkalivibrio TaxID=2621013 RepID=UPI000361AC51|nr:MULTISPECIES: hypothetical protein [unclassified Thioalkalivibrio]
MVAKPDYVEGGETARLIPVAADSNREVRAASVVLAAMRGVFEFRQTMLHSLNVRVGNRADLGAWTEVTFKEERKGKQRRSKNDRPDGLIVLDTGRKKWTALIEAKIGNAEIGEEQLTAYLEQARAHKIDAVITITNQFVAEPSHHPVKLPKTQTRNIELYHWSWMYLLTQATLLLEGNEVGSSDQHFLLEEVVRYLGHESSGISRFDSMNREWKEVVSKVKSGATLNKNSEEVENTVSSWHQEQRDLSLVMSRKLSQPVRLRLSRAHRTDPKKRLKDDSEILASKHILECELEIPNAAAELRVTADLAKRVIVCCMKVGAPQDKKRTSARVNWLRRQLTGIDTTGLFVKAIRPGRAESTQAPLADVLEDADALEPGNTDVVPTAFEIFYMSDLASRFSGSKVFIEELERAVPHFYEQAGQRLRAWVPPPPKIKRGDPASALSSEESAPENDEGHDNAAS